MVGDVEDGPPAPAGSLPQTKTELQKLRQSFNNTMHLCAHFYADRALQDDLRMVSSACRPVTREYHRTLQQQKNQDWVSQSAELLLK